MAKNATAAVEEDAAALIAEAAYFKSEQRGFVPGNELADWLAAESEIAAILAAARKAGTKKAAAAKKAATKKTSAASVAKSAAKSTAKSTLAAKNTGRRKPVKKEKARLD